MGNKKVPKPMHPGIMLEDLMKEKGVTIKEIAYLCDITEYRVTLILNGKLPIKDEFAVQLENILGIDAYYWMDLQANYERELIKYNEAMAKINK